ncbi:hypothetical protein FA13DRAFT_1697931 [Coprinellus micaceus]|uniref:Fungal-type protein kinase domain-containing protein n=1 Tax=Coprinellus micaceus TaxID=71717 RepID=A0A4Y7SCG0_COPMI|nr:hypothetical protein FA13DRAFT_1697931 [Coprinellus micaceus]
MVRQIFAHQPNRKFVRCLLVSEKTFRLVHFDRSGAEVSQRFNIHAHYAEFVRIVVALASPDEAAIGFDTSIQWTIDPLTGRKIAGTLQSRQRTNGRKRATKKTYYLVEVHPIARHIIRGRATTCWLVAEVPENWTQTFVVKDSWTSAGRTEEQFLLVQAAELKLQGVCEYVSHETKRGETKDFRSDGSKNNILFSNRVAARVIFKAYGKHLQSFKTTLQLLMALYDAISGHAQLSVVAKMLHRDINDTNVLLGLEDASVGWRGVLIDLGVATRLGRTTSDIVKEARTGSRFFQSCSILSYLTDLTKEAATAHCYLDDLEGFLYLLCRIFLTQTPDGAARLEADPAMRIIRKWDSEDAEVAHESKCKIFNSGCRDKNLAIGYIKESWGGACAMLFRKFVEWIGHIQVEREMLRNKYGPQDPSKESIYKPLLDQISSHYTQVLALFDEAIVALGGERAKVPRHMSATSSVAALLGEVPSAAKRPRTRSQSRPDGGF